MLERQRDRLVERMECKEGMLNASLSNTATTLYAIGNRVEGLEELYLKDRGVSLVVR